jgi:prevent-host-death family protein
MSQQLSTLAPDPEAAGLDATELRNRLSETINRAAFGKERVTITRHGKAVVAMVPIEDLRFLEEIEDRIDLEEARAALAEVEADGTTPWKEIKERLGL